LLLGAGAQSGTTQLAPVGSSPKAADQDYKNVHVLKDIPADQLIPAMQFMATSLGVKCDFAMLRVHMKRMTRSRS